MARRMVFRDDHLIEAMPCVDAFDVGRKMPMMDCAQNATLCNFLCSFIYELPYPTIMHPVRMLTTIHLLAFTTVQ